MIGSSLHAAPRFPGALLSGGRASVRRCLVPAALAVAVSLSLAPAPRAAGSDTQEQDVTVRNESGVYLVEAWFAVPHPPALVFDVLTDYEQIPRFMPDVRTSTVLERAERRAVVEQQATARFMMFARHLHLVLEVHEHQGLIQFRDRSGKSFSRYEGSWRIGSREGGAAVRYQLAAKPSFEVPDFLLKRLLRRDAGEMIQRLQREIASRSVGSESPL